MCLHGLHRGRWQGNDPVSWGNGEALEECTRIKMRCRNKKTGVTYETVIMEISRWYSCVESEEI